VTKRAICIIAKPDVDIDGYCNDRHGIGTAETGRQAGNSQTLQDDAEYVLPEIEEPDTAFVTAIHEMRVPT
jgi:hypothetical protein